MVKVTFLSDSGKVLASSERSVSMHFRKLTGLCIFSSHKFRKIFCETSTLVLKLMSTENTKVIMSN